MILCGDSLEMLKTLPDASVRCCITSPPYWGLRDYGHEGQIGLERTPDEYVARLVEVFREVRRVLTDDGTLWLNLGDSYNSIWAQEIWQRLWVNRALWRYSPRTHAAAPRELRAGSEAQRPDRHSVARRLRASGGRLVAAPRHHLAQAEPDARERDGSLHEGA